MNAQLTLTYTAPLQARFEEFHTENPWVYTELVRLARSARGRGANKLGIAQLFEVLRWDTAMTTRSWDGFKLNNSYRSAYSRLIMEREADLAGVFETRKLRAL